MMNYKEKVYQHYRSSFKGDIDDNILKFASKKNIPILKKWIKNLDTNWPVVDLGCGAGELLYAFKTLGFTNLAGCDLSQEQIEIASKKFPNVIKSNLFDYLELQANDSLGIITVFDVIEHLTRQETFDLMTLIYSKLKPGGILIAHLPNGLSPFVGHVFWGDISHEWCLTPSSALTLCLLHHFHEFEAMEHVGYSNSIRGRLRNIIWLALKKILQFFNRIETGASGGSIWTRNFAFKANKPLNKVENYN